MIKLKDKIIFFLNNLISDNQIFIKKYVKFINSHVLSNFKSNLFISNKVKK
jgi:hypothetical protein